MREDLAMMIANLLVSAWEHNNDNNSYTWIVEQTVAVISLSGERLPSNIKSILIANPINTKVIGD